MIHFLKFPFIFNFSSSFFFIKSGVYCILIVSLFSCEENKLTTDFSDFPKSRNGIDNKSIAELGISNFARQFSLKNDTIYLFDFENTPYIRKYNLNFKKIDSLGLASDFNINYPLFQHFDDNGNYVFVNEGEYLGTYKANTNPDNPNSLELVSEIEINKKFNADGVFQAFKFKESMIADAYYPKEGDLIIASSNEINTLNFLIPVNEQIIDEQKDEFYHVLYRNNINVNPKNTLLIQTFSNFPSLQVIDVQGNRKTSKSYLNSKTKKSSITDIYNNFLGANTPHYANYLNSFTTDDYIYTLFLNETWEDILQYNYTHFEIHVFDWQLNPVEKIVIEDQIDALGSFIVLEDKNEIIFLNPNKQEGTYYTKWSF